jgi:hypothetical protein
MSYFLLPKINNNINITPMDNNHSTIKPYLSYSVLKYYEESLENIKHLCEDAYSDKYDALIKMVHPYEYVLSKVPGSNCSVSKLKNKSNLFYDFIEITNTLTIFESDPVKMKSLYITSNNSDAIECVVAIRNNSVDENTTYDEITDENIKNIGENKYNFIFLEVKSFTNLNEYIISFIEMLMIILKNQYEGGSCIIKINYVFHKPVIDILYILTSLYNKTYILKPNSSNITTFDKYIVCKNFDNNNINIKHTLKLHYLKLFVFLKKLENKQINSLLNLEIPYYFTSKINDMNIHFGQQQLESLDLIANILKNKNKDEKMETIKKSNIQKSVAWCEKYNIPFNKFAERTNIFLPIRENVYVD